VIYIWVRETVDWANEQAFRAQLDPAFAPRVDLWNATFDIPFHRFRHRVSEITQLNLSQVRGASRARWETIPDGELVVPIDDDDWLAPDLGQVLEREQDRGFDGYRWTASWIESPIGPGHRFYLLRRRALPWTPEKWICSSNNYAIVKSETTKQLLASHVRASEWVGRAPPGTVRTIDRRLSLINRSLASKTSLRWDRPDFTRSQLLRKFRRYRTLYEPPPDDLAWARPYVELMGELMGRLRVRGSAG
jgi:hypothetical protein